MKKAILVWGLIENSGSWKVYFGRKNKPVTYSGKIFSKDMAIKYAQDEIAQAKTQFGKDWRVKVERKDL